MGRGAIGRGLRARRDSPVGRSRKWPRLVLERMGGRTVDISASRLIDVAAVFRVAMPRTYHYFAGLVRAAPSSPEVVVTEIGKIRQAPEPAQGAEAASRPTSTPTSAPLSSWRSPLLLP